MSQVNYCHGIHTTRKWFKDYMQAHGFSWTACMGIGTGAKKGIQMQPSPIKYLRPEPNVPYVIALRYPKPVYSSDGKELMWILVDGRKLFTPTSVGKLISEIQVRAFEKFTIIKAVDDEETVWKVDRKQAAAEMLEKAPALDAPGGDEPPLPPTELEGALRAAIMAAQQAENHGASLGHPFHFSSTDIREMALLLLRKDAA